MFVPPLPTVVLIGRNTCIASPSVRLSVHVVRASNSKERRIENSNLHERSPKQD